MASSLLLLILAVLGGAVTVWWLVQLVHALRTPQSTWTAAGQSQLIHVLVIVVLGPLGALIYQLTAKPRLRAQSAPQQESALAR